MICLCKRILLTFLFTVVGFSATRLTSYAQACQYHAAASRTPASCSAVSPTGKCSPVTNGTNASTGKCMINAGGEECGCIGKDTVVLTTITVTPNPQTVPMGSARSFVATGHDANGKVVAIAPTWSVVANGGAINSSSGLFTAGTVAGTFTNTVKAASGGISGFATVTVVTVTTDAVPLTGFADLHTHPLSSLGFGGKLFYGGVDLGALLPADPDCQHNKYAATEQQALGHDRSTHGAYDLLHNGCGDFTIPFVGIAIRPTVVHRFQTANLGADPGDDASGFVGQTGKPDFPDWPVWNDLLHQKMWVEWIRRAHKGGLRVMVALAVNNKTLGDMTAGTGDYPTDDKTSADLQIAGSVDYPTAGIKSFVGRHSDFMEVAYSSADVYRIVSANKLAVIIGIEVDHIGNLQVAKVVNNIPFPDPVPPTEAVVRAEIDRLYGEGVRYIFPIHVLDNAFGGSAAYESLFDVSNMREDGHPYDLMCADPIDDIKDIKPFCSACGFTYDNSVLDDWKFSVLQLVKTGFAVTSIPSPKCGPGIGQKNRLGLLPSGEIAINEMMKKGMLIDIDHMSQASADRTLAIATPLGYPINSGHNGVRGTRVTNHNERALRADQYAAIGTLHGMAGVGTAGLNAQQWLTLYSQVVAAMDGGRQLGIVGGFGTDTNGGALGMPPRTGYGYKECIGGCDDCTCSKSDLGAKQYTACLKARPACRIASNACRTDCRKQYPNDVNGAAEGASTVQYSTSDFPLPPSSDGNKTWDYNVVGVAHYGMLPDFLQDVKSLPGGAPMVAGFMTGADYFYRTWKIAEIKSSTVK
jgi:hypothetical protein